MKVYRHYSSGRQPTQKGFLFVFLYFSAKGGLARAERGRGELEMLDLVFNRRLLIIFLRPFCKSVFTRMGKNRLKTKNKKTHKTTCVDLPKLYKSLY